MSAAGANESAATSPGAKTPPSPTIAAAASAYRGETSSERAAA